MYREIVFAADNPDDTTVFWDTPPDFVVEKAELYLKQPYRRPVPVKVGTGALRMHETKRGQKPVQANRSAGR